ncbi:MAG TPA: hypothetical protein VM123_14685, partial [archaeon]|nr:hypothetical protein [archaeon]
MIRRNFLLCVPVVLAVVFGLLATSLSAEQVQQRYSSGNNVGLSVTLGWGGFAGLNGTYKSQFPRNSGNFLASDRGPLWTGIACRDRNGDGLAEDTVAVVDGGAAVVGGQWSIEAADVIYGFAAAGIEPNSRMADLPYNQVYSSLDPDNLANWPAEAREGKDPNGSPVLKGRETIFAHYTDVMVAYTNPPIGLYAGISFYFLDYGDANNMVFGHVYWQNVSEYMQFNASYGKGSLGAEHPDGMEWKGIIIDHHLMQLGYVTYTNHAGWALHSAKGIMMPFSKDPTISTFTPQEPYLWGLKLTRPPLWNGTERPFNHFHVQTLSSEFGVSPVLGSMASSLPHGTKYLTLKGDYDYAPSVTNPFTGRVGLKGYPGYLEPSDTRYNQWIWGGNNANTIDISFAEMNDFAPRDTVSFDFVYMFTYPGVSPLVIPSFTLAEIDNPMMQTAFAPMEDMAAAAQAVFDGGLATPETPVPPSLTIVPGDRQVTITWSDVNITTPDSFYYALQELDADPEGHYQEFDFAGYRLYRNFRGPNNSGAELIYDSDREGVRFFHVDKLSDDFPYYRMKNGQKVWYSLVPFDLNYSPATGEAFSLPDPAAAKTWNQSGSRPGRTTDVIPRSDASNFKPAYVSGVEFFPALGTVQPIFASTYNLAGDGTGKLIDPPVYLAPWADISVTPINPEKLTSQVEVNLACDFGKSDYGPFNTYNYSRANIKFQLGAGDFTAETGNFQGYGNYSGGHLGD